MAIENSKQIDYVSLYKEYVRCTIADSMDWNDEKQHLLLLQEKINNYLLFIESGQIVESYPLSVGKKAMISVYSKYEYTEAAKQFLEQVKHQLEEAGYTFNYKVIEEE